MTARWILSMLYVLSSLTVSAQERPNILIIMVDDMGYSDLGCFGSEIETPNLDQLAANGIRYTQMYNTSKCDSSRSALLSGRYVNRNSVQTNLGVGPTIGEIAQAAGYRTLWAGKNHNGIIPVERGFDRFFGTMGGGSNYFCPAEKNIAGVTVANSTTSINKWMIDHQVIPELVPEDPDFYTTDAFTDYALKWLKEYKGEERPFLLYMAYTAPHNPIQAPEEVVAKYNGCYDSGYQVIRQRRYERMVELGVIDPSVSPLHPQKMTDWSKLSANEQKLEAMRMQVHAAMVDRVDENVGRLIKELKRQGELENTLILFFSDNGAERVGGNSKFANPSASKTMGDAFSWEAIGKQWCYVTNTPLGNHKKSSHEGGVCSPMVVHWPQGIQIRNRLYHQPAHLVDIMSTVLDLAGQVYPDSYNGHPSKPIEGVSLVPSFSLKPMPERAKPIGYDYKFGKGIRMGKWKLVRDVKGPWELYDLSIDRTETKDLAKQYPEKVAAMEATYLNWESHCAEGL